MKHVKLDGLIARNVSNQASNLGSFLDPLADKLLVTSLVLSLTVMDFFPGNKTFISWDSTSQSCLSFYFPWFGNSYHSFVSNVPEFRFSRFAYSIKFLQLTTKIFTEKVEMKASNISKVCLLLTVSSMVWNLLKLAWVYLQLNSIFCLTFYCPVKLITHLWMLVWCNYLHEGMNQCLYGNFVLSCFLVSVNDNKIKFRSLCLKLCKNFKSL